jgi:hypothetical protein
MGRVLGNENIHLRIFSFINDTACAFFKLKHEVSKVYHLAAPNYPFFRSLIDC